MNSLLATVADQHVDPQLTRLTDAIAQRVGQQRFAVWFNPRSTRMDLRNDGLEIAVPNDFISEWIGAHYARSIQEAAHEVLGCSLPVRFCVTPHLFEIGDPSAIDDGGDSSELNGSDLMLASSITTRGRVDCRNGNGKLANKIDGKIGGKLNGRLPVMVALPNATVTPTREMRKAFINGHDARHDARRNGVAASAADVNAMSVASSNSAAEVSVARPIMRPTMRTLPASDRDSSLSVFANRPRLRHDLSTFIVGQSNQLAYNAATYVAEFPGSQYNPLFIHGNCGLGKTHMLQGLCKDFAERHPTKRWMYLTGEEFTNEFLMSLRNNKLDTFRRKVRDLDLLVIDDVHFLGGKKATQEEFLHTFNAIEAMGRQVVMASDDHPKMIAEFGESLINRFVSGMVVRIDPPNYIMRCEILRAMSVKGKIPLSEEVIGWIARRVTQNVRELEGAITRVNAHTMLTGRPVDVAMAQEALGDLDRQLVAPVKPENILLAVCDYFGLEHKDLMSGRRQRTISLARSVAMFLIRKTAKLSFPEIGMRMGKRNHSTVISACRRIERAVLKNERLAWTSSVGERDEEATELVQRLEERSRAMV